MALSILTCSACNKAFQRTKLQLEQNPSCESCGALLTDPSKIVRQQQIQPLSFEPKLDGDVPRISEERPSNPRLQWILISGLLMVFAVLMAAYIGSYHLNQQASSTVLAQKPLSEELSPAENAVQRFLLAEHWQERLQWVRDPLKVEARMQQFYEEYPDQAYHFQRLEKLEDQSQDNIQVFQVTFEEQRPRKLWVGMSRNGEWRVDWASFVAECGITIPELLKTKAELPITLRVYAELGDHYDKQFAFSEDLVCLKLRNPNDENGSFLYGYYLRKSSVGQKFEKMIEQFAHGELELSLSVAHPHLDGDLRQVWIRDLLATNWLLSDPITQ